MNPLAAREEGPRETRKMALISLHPPSSVWPYIETLSRTFDVEIVVKYSHTKRSLFPTRREVKAGENKGGRNGMANQSPPLNPFLSPSLPCATIRMLGRTASGDIGGSVWRMKGIAASSHLM